MLLKGPITTSLGVGFKSLNVTIRKTLGLYANVRPCVSYAPFGRTLHPKMNPVIVRENEEDLDAGIEHRQTDEVFQCLKLITRLGGGPVERAGHATVCPANDHTPASRSGRAAFPRPSAPTTGAAASWRRRG